MLFSMLQAAVKRQNDLIAIVCPREQLSQFSFVREQSVHAYSEVGSA